MSDDWNIIPESAEDFPETDPEWIDKQKRREEERARWEPFRQSRFETFAETTTVAVQKSRLQQQWRSSHKNRVYKFDEDKGWEEKPTLFDIDFHTGDFSFDDAQSMFVGMFPNYPNDAKAVDPEACCTVSEVDGWDLSYERRSGKTYPVKSYLFKEYPVLRQVLAGASAGSPLALIDVGCGSGASTYPIANTFPDHVRYVMTDFSAAALAFAASNQYNQAPKSNIAYIQWDPTQDTLPSSLVPPELDYKFDLAMCIFMLSAVAPERMLTVLQHIRALLKPNGYLLFRDHAVYDMIHVRFHRRGKRLSTDPNVHYYLKGDGTTVNFIESDSFLALAAKAGFRSVEHSYHTNRMENKKTGVVMYRMFFHAVLTPAS